MVIRFRMNFSQKNFFSLADEKKQVDSSNYSMKLMIYQLQHFNFTALLFTAVHVAYRRHQNREETYKAALQRYKIKRYRSPIKFANLSL